MDFSSLIVVKANGTKAKVCMCEKVDNMWKTIMETDGFVGKNGLGKEVEGDLKTPVGEFDLGIAFGFEENVNTVLDYYKINENLYWICDSNSKYYNKMVDCTKVEKDWNDKDVEHLIDEDIAYQYAIEIKYNERLEAGKGSAIFLHCIKNGPTAGCVSISKEMMRFVLENVRKDTKILIEYENKL